MLDLTDKISPDLFRGFFRVFDKQKNPVQNERDFFWLILLSLSIKSLKI
jgi:hypothetical protein